MSLVATAGIGVATTVIVFLLNVYYIVVLAWDVYYYCPAVVALHATIRGTH